MEYTNEKKRTIDGSYCACSKVIGYCHCKLHKGCLTARLMKEHECVQKGCHYFEKHEDALFWQTKNKNKEEKKAAKALRKQTEKEQADALEAIRAHTTNDGDFFAIRVDKEEDRFVVYFIRYGWIDLSQYVYELSHVIGARVFLKEIKNNLDAKHAILRAQNLV